MMPRLLADRLQAVRDRRFVGRGEELELFRAALAGPTAEFNLLFVHGPGGVGKTMLLREYLRIARDAGAPAALVDCRSLEASPSAVLDALRSAFSLSEGPVPLEGLEPRTVLLFDTFEAFAPLDSWYRETLLPQLPAQTLVVLAGRQPPGPAWRTDPGWHQLLRIVPLRNLRPDESRTFLRNRGVPEAQHAHVIDFTHGHPLALTLVAEVVANGGTDTAFVPEHEPEVLRVLLQKFVEQVPGPAHRQALRLSAISRVTSEALLASVLPDADPHELFEWLRGLSFVENGAAGLFPHDLARELLDADFRWRNPEGYIELLSRTAEYTVRRMISARGRELEQACLDGPFLFRQLPEIRNYYQWHELTDTYAAEADQADLPAILDLVKRYEGSESARIAEYWFRRQPRAFSVVLGPQRQVRGLLVLLDVHDVTPEDIATDPALAPALEYAARHVSRERGEELIYQRFLLDREGLQAASAAWTVISSLLVSAYASRPRLAISFHAFRNAEYWERFLRYIHWARCAEADFRIGKREYTVFLHDWRAEPVAVWLPSIAAWSLKAASGAPQPPSSAPAPLIVLSEPSFAEAVRQGLRDYRDDDALGRNPLVRSRVLADAGGGRSASALRSLLLEAAQSLRGSPRTEKFYRALEKTYFEPVESQERAADELGLPFNTYRYRLSNGIARISAWLWARELRGGDAAASGDSTVGAKRGELRA